MIPLKIFQVRIVDAPHENEEGGLETSISSAARRTTQSISHEAGIKGTKQTALTGVNVSASLYFSWGISV